MLDNIHAGEQNAVNTLVSSVERLLVKVEDKNLIENLSGTVERLEKVSQFFEKVIIKEESTGRVLSSAEKQFKELKDTLGLLNDDLYLLKGILGEVYQRKEQIGPAIERGGRTLLKSEKILDGLENNSIIRRVISSDPKDIEPGSF